jgi:hypothetical protein
MEETVLGLQAPAQRRTAAQRRRAILEGHAMRAPEPLTSTKLQVLRSTEPSPSPRWCDPSRKSQTQTLTKFPHVAVLPINVKHETRASNFFPLTFFSDGGMSNIWLLFPVPSSPTLFFCRLVNVITIASITHHYLLPSRSLALSDDHPEHEIDLRSACRVLPVRENG